MSGDYSEELVELIKRTIREACPSDDQCLADEEECFRAHPIHDGATRDGVIESVYADVDGAARLIAAALSSAGWLVPEGSEVREEWGVRHHFQTGATNDTRMGSEEDAMDVLVARVASGFRSDLIRRSVITTPWTPSEPAQEER